MYALCLHVPEKLDPKNICADTKVRLKNENKGFSKEQTEEAFRDIHPAREGREIPISNLYQRLGLKPYDKKAEFKIFDKKVNEVIITLKYNFGKSAIPVVEIGDKVNVGDMIAKTETNDLSVPVHSSINGIVKAISEKEILISAN